MRAFTSLDATTSHRILGTDPSFPWVGAADWIAVENPTNADIWLNVTGPDIPTSLGTAQNIVPAGTAKAFPVSGPAIGITFASAVTVPGSNTGLGARAFILVGKGFPNDPEPMPQYGLFSFATLSASQLGGPVTVAAFGQVLGPYDLGAWGGLAVSVIGAGAQINLQYQHSPDAVTWTAAASIPIYPGVTYAIQLPRYQRFARLVMADTGLGGTPAATVTPRATLTEITAIAVSIAAAFVTTTILMATGVSVNQDYFTQGLQQFEASLTWLQAATVTATVAIYQSTDGVTWFQLRTELVGSQAAGFPLYKLSIPQPLAYTRLSISHSTPALDARVEILANGQYATSPVLYNDRTPVVVYDGADVSLGSVADAVGASTAIGQLKAIHADTGTTLHNDLLTTNSDLATLHTDLSSAAAGTLRADLAAINTALGAAGQLHTDLTASGATIRGDLATLHTDLSSASAGTIRADLSTLHTDLGTLHTDLASASAGTIRADLAAITTALGAAGQLHTDLTGSGATIRGDLATLHTDLSSAAAGTLRGDLGTLHTDLSSASAGTIRADLATVGTNTGNTATNTGTTATNTGNTTTNTANLGASGDAANASTVTGLLKGIRTDGAGATWTTAGATVKNFGGTFTGSNPANSFVKGPSLPSGSMWGFSASVGSADILTVMSGDASAANGDTIWAGHLPANGSTPFISVPNHHFFAPDPSHLFIWFRCSNVVSNPVEINAYYG